MASTDDLAHLPLIGRAHPRIDGPLKVSGQARYTADFHFPDLLYGVPVCATIGHGRIDRIEASSAERMPGVRKIYTHENIGRFYHVSKTSKVMIDEKRPPLEDSQIRYYGQYVALVVADTAKQKEGRPEEDERVDQLGVKVERQPLPKRHEWLTHR